MPLYKPTVLQYLPNHLQNNINNSKKLKNLFQMEASPDCHTNLSLLFSLQRIRFSNFYIQRVRKLLGNTWARTCRICQGRISRVWSNHFWFYSWKLPLKPIRLPVFYYRAFDFIPHTFMFDTYEEFWGLPQLEYSGLVKVGNRFSMFCFQLETSFGSDSYSGLLFPSFRFHPSHFLCWFKSACLGISWSWIFGIGQGFT